MKLIEFDTAIMNPQTGQIMPSTKMAISSQQIFGVMQIQHGGKTIHSHCVLMMNGGQGPLVYGTIDELTTKIQEETL